MNRGLAQLLTWPLRHPIGAIALSILCAALAAVGAARIHADASLQAMFARHDPAAEAMSRVMNDFAAVDDLLVVASIPGAGDATPAELERLKEFADRLVAATSVSQGAKPGALSSLTDGAFYKPDPNSRKYFENVVAPAAMYYLDDAAYTQARARLSRPEMVGQMERDVARMNAPGAGGGLAKALVQDPLALREFAKNLIRQLEAQRPFRGRAGTDAFLSPDGRHLLIFVRGKKPPGDLEFCKELTARTASVAGSLNADHLDLHYAGSYAIAAASASAIRSDMIASIVGSVVCLQLLFLLAYRSALRLFALSFGPIALGLLLGFGGYSLVTTALTPLTAVLGGILAGMAIDYSIQYLSMYESQRDAGATARQAAEASAVGITPAAFGAWATSIVGFLAIGASSVNALREFALLGTLGLTGAFLFKLVLLPMLLMLTDRRKIGTESAVPPVPPPAEAGARTAGEGTGGTDIQTGVPPVPSPAESHTASKDTRGADLAPRSRKTVRSADPAECKLQDSIAPARIQSRFRFSLALLLDWIGRRPRFSIGVSIALFLAAAVVLALHRSEILPLESDLTVMHPRPNSPLETQKLISEWFGMHDWLIVHLRADSPEDLLSLAHRVEHRLGTQAAKEAGVAGSFGLASLLPDPNVAAIRKAAMKPGEAQRIVADFRGVVDQSPFNPDAPEFRDYEKFLAALLTRPPPGIDALLPYRRLAQMLLPHSAFGGAPVTEAITLVFVGPSLDQRPARDRAVDGIRAALAGEAGATLTGISVISHDSERTVRRDLPRLSLLAIVIVLVYLLAHFRNIAEAILSMLPTVFSLAVLLAAMRLAGQKVNMINLVAAPLLIGIDVDYGIFLVALARLNQARKLTRAALVTQIAPVCHAIAICAAATIIGYGTLMWTSVPAIQSLGFAMAVGIGACLFSVLFLLAPIFLSLPRESKE
jgi:predicted RND superfamily exporter protein